MQHKSLLLFFREKVIVAIKELCSMINGFHSLASVFSSYAHFTTCGGIMQEGKIKNPAPESEAGKKITGR
jgi:hypothetical protein